MKKKTRKSYYFFSLLVTITISIGFIFSPLKGDFFMPKSESFLPVPNPDYQGSCNLDLLFVLDASGTMTNNQITAIRDGTLATINYLNTNHQGTVRIGLIEFSSNALIRAPFTEVNTTNINSVFIPALNLYQNGDAGDLTSYGDALQLAITGVSTPDVIMFVTDGLPNLDSTVEEPAIFADYIFSIEDKANQLKNAGAHIYGVAVASNPSLEYLELMTDGDASIIYDGSNGSVADLVEINSFSEYEHDMIALTQGTIGCICEVPTLGLITSQLGTCQGNSPNDDATITVNSISGSDIAGIAVGTDYTNGVAWNPNPNTNAALEAVFGNTVTFSGLMHNIEYTIRLFHPANDCYTDTTITTASLTCNINCDVSIQADSPIYNNNGTSNNFSDDTFSFQVTVFGSGSGGWTTGSIAGIYGVPVTFGPFPVSGQGAILNISDSNNSSCGVSIAANMDACIEMGTCTCCDNN